ncbi:hypothetical protein Mycsm_01389 [Mycobacterium sp. JS623]|uniref:hypothetical protein n=1 Tax=Mycobacterium sp. JS623 TaxID=212767 RepID=UPI0002A5A3F3|nr:hypothetical protein [Mycobacterium sp. JS623]AGB21801.1 hypothetical protein Mycsm_01389 [Mycobacterium sp. JS623]
MNRIRLGVGAAAIAIVGNLAIGTGTAHAFPNVEGGLWKDAQKTLTDAGYTVKIAGRVGDKTSDDKCVVDHAQEGSKVDGFGKSQGKIAEVFLNCYANVASPNSPGYSAGSVPGRAVLQAEQDAQQKAAAQQAAGG